MFAVLAAEVGDFVRPPIDWHAAAPELTLLAFGVLLTLMDIVWLERGRKWAPALASIGLLATMIPIITLAVDGADRSMFSGAFVIDNYALIMKAVFVLAGYIVVLISSNYIAEGDYWENEYYGLLLSSILGMVLMASARDLITIFVALELLSIPAYMLATWRKRDLKSNEAGIKYYLMGVFASAVMLYGMSLLYGASGTTLLVDINEAVSASDSPSAIVVMGIIFVIVGFAFKVSAVPFHTWAPDTYEGAPTPVTAFLSVASKAAGFVALMNILFVGFIGREDVYEPMVFALAAVSMTVGNLIALRQTNIVRMLAYSGVAQAGYMLAPLAVASDVPDSALAATVSYLVIYAAMNLGAFTVVIAVARKSRSAEIEDYRGLFHYAPGLTVAMTIFLFALAGIPPLGGWWAKFRIMGAVIEANTVSGVVLGVFVAVNSVIALYYYARIGAKMWADEAPDGDLTPIRVPASLTSALVITVAATIVFGILPGLVGDITKVSLLAGVGG
ncbi:MAG: NADH-quinone oxidoreductase subunit N [Acidimicrobiales bacterium]|nr:NADH-quinone oxidoreductase subunit N [Acidimicrobiales bacterium]MDG2218501.1 NADH-quinone oxidoreductase subunit N [Acidimicrobiales bacterium]